MDKHNILAIVVGVILAVLVVFICLNLDNLGNSDNGAAEATTEYLSDEITVDYSKGYDDNGYLKDVKASDIVTVCDYQNLQIESAQVEPTDEEVESEIENLLSDSGYGIYEGTVEDGNTVNIDYTGTIDGEEFSGGSATGQNLEIGSGTFIDNFEEQLIGHSVGESFDVTVTFPSDYASDDIAGKEAVFSVTINYILPELSDDFVAANFSETNGISTVDELKNKLKENLRTKKEDEYIWDYLLSNSTFEEIPDDVMNARLDVSLDALRKQYHDYMGYSDEDIINMYGYESMDDVKEELRPDTEELVKTSLIAQAISDEQGISVDDDAIAKYLGEDEVDTYIDAYGKPYVASKVLITLVSDYLMENATLN